jgi:serine/threonine-protein kinase
VYGAGGTTATQGYGPPGVPGGPTYAPQGPGGPPFGPTGTPPGGGKRNPLPIILGAAAVVVALVVVLVVVLTRGDGGGGGGGGTATDTSTTATETTTPTTAPTTETTTATPTEDPQDQLLAIIPGAFDRGLCRKQDSPGDGDIAALDCGASAVQPGPSDSAFYLYADPDTADGIFLDDTENAGLSQLASDTHCPDAQGFENYTSNGVVAGRIACYVRSSDNASVLFWTQKEYGAEGYVFLADGGEEGLKTLVDWWRDPSNSDFTE